VCSRVKRSCGCATPALPDLHHYPRIRARCLTTDVMVGLTTMYSTQKQSTHRHYHLKSTYFLQRSTFLVCTSCTRLPGCVACHRHQVYKQNHIGKRNMGCISSCEARDRGIPTGPGQGPVIAGRHMFTPPRRGPFGSVSASDTKQLCGND
jgi:hypothetical protein